MESHGVQHSIMRGSKLCSPPFFGGGWPFGMNSLVLRNELI